LLQVNCHREVLWFNKEAFETLLLWLLPCRPSASRDPQRPILPPLPGRHALPVSRTVCAAWRLRFQVKLRAAVIEADRPQPAAKTRGNKEEENAGQK
jgi:hypothetical protein